MIISCWWRHYACGRNTFLVCVLYAWPLLRTAFYTVGLFFSLRGGDEHRSLKASQLTRVPASGYDATKHIMFTLKMVQRITKVVGVKLRKIAKLFVPMLCKDLRGVLFWSWTIFLKKLPSECVNFYMQPLQSVPSNPTKACMVKNVPMVVNPLRSIIYMMSKISKLSGLTVNYSNHILRATSASRMFASGVIVAEFTGHKSLKSFRQYEKTTNSQLQAVGNSISRMEEYTGIYSLDDCH